MSELTDVSKPLLALEPTLAPLGPAPLTHAERWSIAGTSAVEAAVFAWAYVLPWDKFTVWCVLSIGLSALHGVVAVAMLVPALAWARLKLWRATSTLALLTFAWGTWAVFSSAWYLSRLYEGLGQGLSAALFALWGLLMLVTVPTAAWGFVRTRGVLAKSAFKATLGGLVVAVLLGSASPSSQVEEGSQAADEWSTLLAEHLAPLMPSLPQVAGDASAWSANAAKRSTACDLAPSETETAFVFYRDRRSGSSARCYQASSLRELALAIKAGLTAHAASDLILVDRVTHTRPIRNRSPLLDPLMLRPGLDGACVGGTCLAPWQLIARGAFTTHAPLPFLADLKFGLSLDALRKQLSKHAAGDELVAVETQSMSLSVDGIITALRRHHPIEVPLTPHSISLATERYSAHIVAAQQANGQFRYTLEPFSGKADVRNFSIPRQAGTLLVLCELGQNTPEVDQTVRRGLQLLLAHRREHEGKWALALDKKAKIVRLGDSALPLVAFTTCRSRVGREFDDAIRGLSEFVLSQQEPDGSFTSSYDWKKRRKLGGPEALYAPGQALLGLTLLDSLVLANNEGGTHTTSLGDHDVLTRAIQRGMDNVAHAHWDIAMYPFFFIEENWNCLTARAALSHQRNDAYERFCIDYMRFKSRLILAQTSQVAAEFLGGFGFGNVIPPHNTGAAGFGEAMAALIAVKRERGESTSEDEARLESVLRFLLRQQWTPETCYACAPGVVGSMSEHIHSPVTRIDFTQHAWAAVGHGSTVLGKSTP